jgi:Fe-S cluster assembly iron-binding protein IscA
MAHEKAEERMKEKGNDELLVMVRGSCWGERAFGIVLDEQQATDHYIYEVEGKYVAIPKGSEDFVKSLEIDFEKTKLYESLVINTKYK